MDPADIMHNDWREPVGNAGLGREVTRERLDGFRCEGVGPFILIGWSGCGSESRGD